MTSEQHKTESMPFNFGNIAHDWTPNNAEWKRSLTSRPVTQTFTPNTRGRSKQSNRPKNSNVIAKLELGEYKEIRYTDPNEQRRLLSNIYAQRRHMGKEFHYQSRNGTMHIKRTK